MLRELVLRNRSYRRFREEVAVDIGTLRELVDLARLSASAANMQPLRYVLSADPERNALIFPYLGWAAYLTRWPGPSEGERPSAYIVILRDTQIGHPMEVDHGIAAQTILLGATEKGLGGCMIGAIDKNGLRGALEIPERYEILLVVALGEPAETVVIDAAGPGGDTEYWRDGEGTHHVPKQALDDIIIG